MFPVRDSIERNDKETPDSDDTTERICDGCKIEEFYFWECSAGANEALWMFFHSLGSAITWLEKNSPNNNSHNEPRRRGNDFDA